MPYGLEIKDAIIFAAGAVVALMVAYIFYKKGLRRKQLTYSLRVRGLVYRSGDYPAGMKDGLKITFDGRDIERLTRVTVFVWNSGNQPITKSDLDTKVPLTIKLPDTGFDPLQTSVALQSRTASNVVMEGLRLKFDYLNSGDGLAVDIFGDKTDKDLKLGGPKSPVKLEGEIIGTTRPPTYETYEFSASRAPGIAMISFGLIFCLIGAAAALFSDAGLRLSPELDRKLNLVGGGLFGFFGAVVLAIGLFMTFTSEKMPSALSVREDGTTSILDRVLGISRS